ncbi:MULTISPECIES: hypothetical protein [unclassified Nocardia]|uniref:hypothetical protein n=1 Tax=unclassified Nocardia TaxID=2637762 RepID=UPI003420F05D
MATQADAAEPFVHRGVSLICRSRSRRDMAGGVTWFTGIRMSDECATCDVGSSAGFR